jgi:hypothetical protein
MRIVRLEFEVCGPRPYIADVQTVIASAYGCNTDIITYRIYELVLRNIRRKLDDSFWNCEYYGKLDVTGLQVLLYGCSYTTIEPR